jgi:CDP-diacylglycerol--serine O-phosphatidyltransferase
MIKKHIPNFITLLNLFCGCIAIVCLSEANYDLAFYFASLGIILDFFDGFFARVLNAYSPLGLQLDSLADMVTSGVAPGYMSFLILQNYTTNEYVPFLGFLVTLGAAYRLAKFNISTNQSEHFIGLPVPANTLLVMGFCLIIVKNSILPLNHLYFILGLVFFSTIMQNVNLPLFSLKIKSLSPFAYPFQFVLIFIAGLGLAFYQLTAIPFVIVLYIFLSLIKHILYANQKKINP